MRLIFYESLASTQVRALEIMQPNLCIATHRQTDGIGSRENTWDSVESGLYFSLTLHKNSLPKDLPIQSTAIYMGFIFKEVLQNFTSKKLFVKWPNDIYCQSATQKASQKIGGVLVNIKSDLIICGIGINYLSKTHASLEKKLDSKRLLLEFSRRLGISKNHAKKRTTKSKVRYAKKSSMQSSMQLTMQNSWERTLRKYRLEFAKSHPFSTAQAKSRIPLKSATLLKDGSIIIDNKRIFGRVSCVK